AQAILGMRGAFRRNAEGAVGVQPVAEEFALLDWGDGALLLVDAEPQAAFQEPPHRGHDPFPRRRRPHIDIAVIGPRVRPSAGPRTGATAEPVAAAFELL